MKISVVLPTYSPHRGRLEATLDGLACQTLPRGCWELVLVDNASVPPVDENVLGRVGGGPLRLLREEMPGLAYARRAGIRTASASLIVLCDDDNVLAPEYLEAALRRMEAYPSIGVAGGRSLPLYETPPPDWFDMRLAPLGCRDFGDVALIFSAEEFRDQARYPECSPIGAGMVLRREAMDGWLQGVGRSGISDRRGRNLSSAGDCDMVLHALKAGYGAAYWPELTLEHLLPAERLELPYLAALSRAAYRDFVKVLDLHGIRPWGAISRWSLPARAARAWLTHRAWSGPENYIRWQASLGQFEARSTLSPE